MRSVRVSGRRKRRRVGLASMSKGASWSLGRKVLAKNHDDVCMYVDVCMLYVMYVCMCIKVVVTNVWMSCTGHVSLYLSVDLWMSE